MTWRSPARDDRQIATLWAFCAVTFLALRPLWLVGAGLLPACPWHAVTGLACPGCGSTRAILRLLEGEFAAGFAFNPLATCAAVGFVVGGIAAPVWLAAGGLVPVIASKPRPVGLAFALSIVGANWAWLVYSGV
jgi:Protein of unknown function (DUF2752)